MNDECVIGVYDSHDKAEQAVRILQRGDFPPAQISLIAPGIFDKAELAQELEDDSVRDAAIGAGLGGALGLLGAGGVLAASGVGGVFLFGPIAAGLTGATVGAFLGGLTGWGVHHRDIEHYEQCVNNRQTLILVHGSPVELVDAERILKETDAAEVRLHAQTSSEAPEVTVP